MLPRWQTLQPSLRAESVPWVFTVLAVLGMHCVLLLAMYNSSKAMARLSPLEHEHMGLKSLQNLLNRLFLFLYIYDLGRHQRLHIFS